MKEAQIFENWINNLSEGTWALPETPEQMEKLNELMSGELIVGPDATNATEQLYDIVGDDELFDILNDLADRSEGRANIWDDSDVQRRLAELGIQTPQSTQAEPADVDQNTAPPVAEGELDEQVMGGQMNMFKTFSNNVANGQDAKQAALAVAKDYGMKPEQVMFDLASFGKQSPQWIDTPELQNAVKTLQQLAAANRAFDPQIEESNELAEGDDFGPGPGYPLDNQAGPIYAGPERIPNTGVPDKKNYKAPLSDKYGPVGHAGGWDAAGQQKYIDRTAPGVINKIKDKLGLDMPDPNHGPRPDERERLIKRYPAPANENAELARMLKHAGVPLQEGVLTDSTGSTLEHIKDTFKRDIKDFSQSGEMSEHLFRRLYDYYFDDMPYGAKTGDDIDPYQWVGDRFAEDLGINENLISPMIMPVSEGSCNMTMEGEYCPEHGLAKCESMYEDSRSRTVPPRPNIQDMPRTKSVAGPGRGKFQNPTNTSRSFGGTLPTVNVTAPRYNPDLEPIRVDVRGIGNLINDIPAGKKLINPMQPRRHNELSPLEPGDSTPLSKVANVDLTMDEGVYDPDYRGGYNNEFDELEDLLSRSGMSQDDLMRQRFLASKHGLNTPADMSKLPALKKDAETGYVARKAALDADLEKRNQQYLQDKLTDLEYQQDPIAFVKRRTQQLAPTAPVAPSAQTAPADVAAGPGTDYSLPRAKLGSSPSTRLPNFRPEPAAEVPASSDQTDTRNQKSSMFQQLAQLRNRTRGTMAETSNDDPINSNSAMTGAYYEGKETQSQEGDALLARIKSLALLR